MAGDNNAAASMAMTGAQKSYLKTLSDEAKEPFDATLTKPDASRGDPAFGVERVDPTRFSEPRN
jgi:hypothetical protein